MLGRGGGVGRRGESGDETRLGERGGIKTTRDVVGRSEPRSSSATNISTAVPLIRAGIAEHVNYSQEEKKRNAKK